MVLKNAEAVQALHATQIHVANEETKLDASEESSSQTSEGSIPKRLWVLHGSVMFGREFCYAMETALVTPVLLQIGTGNLLLLALVLFLTPSFLFILALELQCTGLCIINYFILCVLFLLV